MHPLKCTGEKLESVYEKNSQYLVECLIKEMPIANILTFNENSNHRVNKVLIIDYSKLLIIEEDGF
ncbi:hypothetical protein GCM10011397_19210 [Wenyingzhuangia marina]|nr:hypothetical protein GCM10011397_19210 [Wenyingzhuangia marina]